MADSPDTSPFFSVVVPLYNKEKTLARTLTHILAQTFGSFEIVIADDGSTDGSIDVARSFDDRRIRIFSQCNSGSGAARNLGIKNARANFITFIDADDIWHPNHLQDLFELIQEYRGVGFYATAYRLVYPSVKRAVSITLRETERSAPHTLIDNYFEYAAEKFFINADTVAIEKWVFDKMGMFEPGVRNGQDILYWAVLGLNLKLAYSGIPSSDYYKEIEGQTTSLKPGIDAYNFRYVGFLADSLKNGKVPEGKREYFMCYGRRLVINALFSRYCGRWDVPYEIVYEKSFGRVFAPELEKTFGCKIRMWALLFRFFIKRVVSSRLVFLRLGITPFNPKIKVSVHKWRPD